MPNPSSHRSHNPWLRAYAIIMITQTDTMACFDIVRKMKPHATRVKAQRHQQALLRRHLNPAGPYPSLRTKSSISAQQALFHGAFYVFLHTLRFVLIAYRFDSAPTDTLLNLGFVPGTGMAQDFLDLCENPEPIEPTPAGSIGSIQQDEDEEAVWRRLVMRGRFV